MDKNVVLGVTAIICLTILGIFIINYIPESKVLYAIVVIIGGLAGFYIPRAVNKYVQRLKKTWKK